MRILFCLLIISLVACNSANPKEQIVERQKQINRMKDSLDVSVLQLEGRALDIEMIEKEKEDRSKDSTRIKTRPLYDSLLVLRSNVFLKKVILQAEYDSLEMELKKY